MRSPQECNSQNATVRPHLMVKKLPSDLLIFSLSTFTKPAASITKKGARVKARTVANPGVQQPGKPIACCERPCNHLQLA